MLRAKPARTRGTQAPSAGLVPVVKQRHVHRCSTANGTRADAATNLQQSGIKYLHGEHCSGVLVAALCVAAVVHTMSGA